MDRCALFVDAGYALADGAMAVHGTRRRDSVSWDHAGLLKLLAGLARDRTGLPVLRCYWYETASEGRRTAEHDALAEMPGLKLRLVNALPGRREGIESQLRRDLVTLAKSGAITDAFIASANEHIAEIVAEVQDLGLRVVILHIASDGGWTIPLPLRQECDDIVEISGVHLRSFVDLIKGAEPISTEDQYPSGAYGVRGMGDAKGVVMGALTHQGMPAAALPPPGAVYQVPENRDPRADAPAYGGQPAQPQFLGAPTAGSMPGQQTHPQDAVPSAANSLYDAGPAQPAQAPGQPNMGQAMSAPAYQNGTTGIYQGTPGIGYPGSAGPAGAGQPPAGQQVPGQPDVSQAAVHQTGPILSNVNQTGPIAVNPGQPQNGAGQNGYPAERGLTAIPANGFPTSGFQRGPAHNGTGHNGAELGYPGQPQNGMMQNGMMQNGQVQNGTGQNGAAQGNLPQNGPAQNGPAQTGPAQTGTGQFGYLTGQGPGTGPTGYPVRPEQNAVPPATQFSQQALPALPAQPAQSSPPAPPSLSAQPPQPAYPAQPAHPAQAMQPPAPGNQGAPQPGLPAQSGQPGQLGQAPGQTQSYQYLAGQQGQPGLTGQNQHGQGLTGQNQHGQGQHGPGQPGQGQGQPGPGQGYPGQGHPGLNHPGQGNPGQGQPATGQPSQLPAGPGYPIGQNGNARPGTQQSGVFQAGQFPLDARPRDPYGQGAAPPVPPGFNAAPVPFAGPPGFGPPDSGFDQGLRASFGQSQAQGVGALMQSQAPGQQPMPQAQAVRVQQPVAIALPEAVKAAHAEGYNFGESVGRDAPGLWLEAVLARKPRMPSDLEARLLQGSVLPIDSLLHDEVRHSLRRGFWDALESARR
ncbi:MAG TPA: hypothetical protein VMA95_01080 [Streptosporangiaceae bacterium]|nr:hypothetical protein [Streptosporangiaceae bacterium]